MTSDHFEVEHVFAIHKHAKPTTLLFLLTGFTHYCPTVDG